MEFIAYALVGVAALFMGKRALNAIRAAMGVKGATLACSGCPDSSCAGAPTEHADDHAEHVAHANHRGCAGCACSAPNQHTPFETGHAGCRANTPTGGTQS